MRRSISLFAKGFLLLFIFLSFVGNDVGPMAAEARTCESKSFRFKGPCFRDTNCGSVCQTEGFKSGHCKGFRRRCFCTKHC